MAALETKIGDQTAAVETVAQAVTEAQAAAETGAVGTDDASLQAVLEAMSSKTVNESVVSWSKEVLGVGTAVGKIDEMKSVLEAQAVDPQGTAAVETEKLAESEAQARLNRLRYRQWLGVEVDPLHQDVKDGVIPFRLTMAGPSHRLAVFPVYKWGRALGLEQRCSRFRTFETCH